MDSNGGAGALALPATPVPPNPFSTANDEQALSVFDSPPQAPMFGDFSFDMPATGTANLDNLDTPVQRSSFSFEPSNLREHADDPFTPVTSDVANLPLDPLTSLDTTTNGIADMPPFTDGLADTFMADGDNIYAQYNAALDTMVADDDNDMETQFTEDIEEPPAEPMQAYAKLCLPDGDYYIKSLQVMLGRDMDYFKEFLKEKKRAQKAQRALDEYALEPSQPSQPDEAEGRRGPSSRSSQSLIGRPARGLPSHYSEQGGAVSYAAADSDDEFTSKKARRRRRLLDGTASSTASIAPANLHPNMMGDFSGNDQFATEGAAELETPIERLYVHPKVRADITKISKDHLLFLYNFDSERWELKVVGRTVFVNQVLHKQDDVVPLEHGDVILLTSLSIEFKLPENFRSSPGVSRGTFADSDDLELSELDEEDEAMLLDSPAARKAGDDSRPKLKLKLNKKKAQAAAKAKEEEVKAQTGSGVKQEKEVQTLEKTPEMFKKPAKKPSTAGLDATPSSAMDLTEDPFAGSPPVPASIEPGSIFEGVAAEELPQKRKGPGRPPKNGLISKRDQSFVKRKLKEYEKRGEAPPPMDELVSIVRAENKAKELAAKAAARGEAPPDASIVQSIEMDQHGSSSKIDPLLMNSAAPTATPTPAEPIRRPSPKPKRVARSPSPMKPESEYNEEELKKPTMTYVHILDEILRDHEDGKADLQEIYDRICKRYPYFKYRVSTAGWQSSVRHNLLQHDRFMENGRSGKGRLWAINHNCPIDKEKKRRITPPPRPPMPAMQNGQFQQGQQMPQYGQQNYNTPYGPPGVNRQQQYHPGPQGGPGYYSPYAPNQQGQGPYGPPQNGAPPMGMNQGAARPQANPPAPNGAPAPNQGQAQQAQNPPAQHPPFQPFVEEIMVYRSQYLSHFAPGSDDFNKHEELFKKCTSYISELFHGTSATVKDRLESEEEKAVFMHLEKLYERYRHLSQPAGKTPEQGTPGKTPGPDAAKAPSQAPGQQQQPQQPQQQTVAGAQAPVQPVRQGQPVQQNQPVQQSQPPQQARPVQPTQQAQPIQQSLPVQQAPQTTAGAPQMAPPNGVQAPVNGAQAPPNNGGQTAPVQQQQQPQMGFPQPQAQPQVQPQAPPQPQQQQQPAQAPPATSTAQNPIVLDDSEPNAQAIRAPPQANATAQPMPPAAPSAPAAPTASVAPAANTAPAPAPAAQAPPPTAAPPQPPPTAPATQPTTEQTGLKRAADSDDAAGGANGGDEQDAKRVKMG